MWYSPVASICSGTFIQADTVTVSVKSKSSESGISIDCDLGASKSIAFSIFPSTKSFDTIEPEDVPS